MQRETVVIALEAAPRRCLRSFWDSNLSDQVSVPVPATRKTDLLPSGPESGCSYAQRKGLQQAICSGTQAMLPVALAFVSTLQSRNLQKDRQNCLARPRSTVACSSP